MSGPAKELKVLIVDDEQSVRELLSRLLSDSYLCFTAESGGQALALLQADRPALVISDINMPGMSGVELLTQVHELSPDTVTIVISGNQTMDNAIGAIRAGAFDFLTKPFDLDHVEIAVHRALEHHCLLVEKRAHDEDLERLVEERTKRLEYLAYYDELTGLRNSAFFDERLQQALQLAGTDYRAAVLLVSPNRFREIRDTLGHSSGNEMLKEFAGRLSRCVGPEATVARYEADEFAVLLPEISNAAEVAGVAGRLLACAGEPLRVAEHSFDLTASIGISLYPEDGSYSHSIIKSARIALAHANAEGHNSYEFYTTEMQATAMRRLDLENSLRHAMENSELNAHYQPKIDIRTGRIVGAEALMRWSHPVLGRISPLEFIAIAEDTGLIVDFGAWILGEACRQTKAWHDAGYPISIAVNVCARQFKAGLAEIIRTSAEVAELDPQFLNIEVTESSIMTSAELAVNVFDELKELGITVSIDDFGTGYSSLGQLRSLPVDVLKIDKSFVNDLSTDRDAASLVTAVIALAHNLDLRVVAEGVETEAQLQFLELVRCDEFQGFLFSRPLPAQEFGYLLDAQTDTAKDKRPPHLSC
ncbi:MAG: putative bifunctional diguanylate cyclase/phosphodiesterase [Pyrinomonadaceae bacterium]